jgi:hypothetical protein
MFFYDKQVRRYLQQVIAVFSGFEVSFNTPDGSLALRRVPCRYGDPNRMVAQILKNNSENTMNSVPLMTVYITNLQYDRERIQDPTFVDRVNIRERKLNQATGNYSVNQGNALTVERLMPVPYKLTINLDIWTSNTDQKLQLFEQISVLFNPSFEIQSTDNYLDWGSLTVMNLENTNWSSRSVPAGTDDAIDVQTFTFTVPIWLSAPAKVKKLGVIQTIITSLYDETGNITEDFVDAANLLKNRSYITPLGYNLLLLNGSATLVPAAGPLLHEGSQTNLEVNPNSSINWGKVISLYGQLTNGISQLRLRKDNPDTVSEIVGTVAQHPTDPSQLLFTSDVDTIPANSMKPIDAIIDPTRSRPGSAGIPSAARGQRYLILDDINAGLGHGDTQGVQGWKNSDDTDFVAKANDIIEYSGTAWQVAWAAASSTKTEFVVNLKTGIQYKFNSGTWIKSFEGEYKSGEWRLVL